MREIRLLKVEGFGSSMAKTSRWLGSLVSHLRSRIPALDIKSTIWSEVTPQDLLGVDAVIGHSYGIAGTVRALGDFQQRLPILLALDPVPRWTWGQSPGWTLPYNVDACMVWYQRNLGPCGEPFKVIPKTTQFVKQLDISNRGVLHTSLPHHWEVRGAVTEILRSLAGGM